MAHRKKSTQRQWYRMDLHLHTPASADYKQSNVTFLDILKKAEEKNLDVIAITDHNTVAGYAKLLAEIESLEMLERLQRLRDDERARLNEYRRLREKILLLPGFEFTATLGFHILAIFPPTTTVRELEHLLLLLRIPPDKLDSGSSEVGATSDVLTAYRVLNQAGALVIAAHANSSHGVAMPGIDFGGQTRIAYTQDPNLHALEVTDLDSKSRRRTALFFSGTKPEYPRRMHCIQGSDAHRLDFDPRFKNELGIGDRVTEILLEELSFEAIKAVFLGNDFARTRPYHPTEPFDPLREAREHGETLIQAFHERLHEKRSVTRRILEDVVALANTNGGTIYIGASADVRKPVVGVERPESAINELRAAIAKNILPPLEVQIEVLKSQGKSVLQVIVPRGSQVPYVLDESYIYIRSENETGLAVRDEILQLVRDALAIELAAQGVIEPPPLTVEAPSEAQVETPAPLPAVEPPRTGVEIVSAEQRKGVWYYSVRDLRNRRIVQNVTLKSARRLWQYAIAEREKHPFDPQQLQWVENIALIKTYKRAGKVRYDLAQRVGEQILVYYGVTDDGIHGPWRTLIESQALTEEEIPEEPEQPAAPPEHLTPPELLVTEEITQPLIIEEEIPLPEAETPLVPQAQAEPPTWFEQVSVAEEEGRTTEEEGRTTEGEGRKTEDEGRGTALAPAASSPLVPKSRAQEWREQLERALEEARRARAGTSRAESSPAENGS
jgi:hypothetical protein